MKKSFKNEFGVDQVYELDLRQMKKVREFARNLKTCSTNPDDIYYFFNNYCRGTWNGGCLYHFPTEPGGDFPDYFYDTSRDEIWRMCDYKKQKQKKSHRKTLGQINKTITEFKIDKKDIYISVNAFAGKIPQEIIANGIGVGNGIFLINILHFEKYRNATG